MVLPAPYCMGTQVSFQDIGRPGLQGCFEVQPCFFRSARMWNCRTECAKRPCTLCAKKRRC